MQNIFLTYSKPEAFSKEVQDLFPDAPVKCTFKDCNKHVKMKKHGFYKRYVITHKFSGYIYIRRYICPCCGHTISFLPSFLVPHFQYTLPFILSFLLGFFKRDQSIRKYVKWFNRGKSTLSRRNLRYYINRLTLNQSSIEHYLNLTNQDATSNKDAMVGHFSTKTLLEKIHKVPPHYFSWKFFTYAGRCILSPV